MITYSDFIAQKSQLNHGCGFAPLWMPEFLFDFQRHLVEWAILKGRAAIFADCGLGKTPMQLVWAENVVRKTNKPVLVLTPLAVGQQTCREAEKFGIEAVQSRDGKHGNGIVVTNYERLHYFQPENFAGLVCDESSILKNFDGRRKAEITEFCKKMKYRLLCTATAAPNDYIELGTSSEALGCLGHMDMLSMFFKNDERNPFRPAFSGNAWRLKRHAELSFWRWVCSWARACRKPSDLGFNDCDFVLPPLNTEAFTVPSPRREGCLFAVTATTLEDQREERRLTIGPRCEVVADRLNRNGAAVAWCHLNEEGDTLAKMVNGAEQVAGSDSDERKEEIFTAFVAGQVRVLVTKPKIAGFGMNWQHCHHMTIFPSHSFEQFYQAVRRIWRFGQLNPVQVDVVTSECESEVLENMNRKARAAEDMFSELVAAMNNAMSIDRTSNYPNEVEVPSWL